MDVFEPYEQNIIHSTIMRFSNSFDLRKENIDYIIDKYGDQLIGSGQISGLNVELASWKT